MSACRAIISTQTAFEHPCVVGCFRLTFLRGSSFACDSVEDSLAQTKRLWRRLHELIELDVLDGALQRHSKRRFKLYPFAFALAAHVSKMLLLAWVDWQIFRAGVFAYNHAFVNVLLWTNEKAATLLNII